MTDVDAYLQVREAVADAVRKAFRGSAFNAHSVAEAEAMAECAASAVASPFYTALRDRPRIQDIRICDEENCKSGQGKPHILTLACRT